MGFTKADWSMIEGTGLVGYVTGTRREIEAVLGAPDEYGESDGDGKVTTEWLIRFDDGTVATIYDWKRYEDGAPGMDELYRWHIGGREGTAVRMVGDLLGGR